MTLTSHSDIASPAVLSEKNKHLTLYQNMSTSIAECHAIDECKDIIDKSVALSAYYKQVKDTETERKFYQVKLRAWRRIGEFLSVIDVSDCIIQSAKVKKIRDNFIDPTIAEMSDSRIGEILRLMEVPDESFEISLNRIDRGTITGLLNNTPEYRAEIDRRTAANEEREKLSVEQRMIENAREREVAQEQQRRQAEYDRRTRELREASDTALKEVGITLDRKDRLNMKEVVFLIKDDIHSVMRKAAFDEKITMQEILRRGLKMWLIAHGYDFPEGKISSAKPGRQRAPI